MEPSLASLLRQDTLKWIFFGGKGGVGKTTTSSSFAVSVATAHPERRYLLISTDPAHNLSDAFDQKFGRVPTQVSGLPNLFAVEVSPAEEIQRFLQSGEDAFRAMDGAESGEGGAAQGQSNPIGSALTALSGFFKRGGDNPGLDEVIFFSKIIEVVKDEAYSCVIFDTAPTGHTLRFLGLPETAKSLLKTVLSLQDTMGGMLQAVSGMMGLGSGPDAPNISQALETLRPLLETVEKIGSEFRSPALCTFVCVCIPEFLSLYETERLVQRLAELDMDTHALVVNMVLDANHSSPCALCRARAGMQQKYIAQIRELYDDFNVVLSPLLPAEVRGIPALQRYAKTLLEPFRFCWD